MNYNMMMKIVEQEGLNSELITPNVTMPGMIRFYIGGQYGGYNVELNGERGPIVEYHNLTEEEACYKCLDLLRSLDKSYSSETNSMRR